MTDEAKEDSATDCNDKWDFEPWDDSDETIWVCPVCDLLIEGVLQMLALRDAM